MLKIKDWNKTFENRRSREIEALTWVRMPNKHDGDSFLELLDHPQGLAHYGAWALIIQISSKCTPRGCLTRKNGEGHTAASMARIVRGDPTVFGEAISRLLALGWLEETDEVPTGCRPGADEVPTGCRPGADPKAHERRGEERRNSIRPSGGGAEASPPEQMGDPVGSRDDPSSDGAEAKGPSMPLPRPFDAPSMPLGVDCNPELQGSTTHVASTCNARATHNAAEESIPAPDPDPEDGVPIAAGKNPLPSATPLIAAWNKIGGPFSRIAKWTSKRRSAFRARTKDPWWSANWETGLAKMRASAFCRGGGKTGWVGDVDWFLREDTLAKILEGKYDDRETPPDKDSPGFGCEKMPTAEVLDLFKEA